MENEYTAVINQFSAKMEIQSWSYKITTFMLIKIKIYFQIIYFIFTIKAIILAPKMTSKTNKHTSLYN